MRRLDTVRKLEERVKIKKNLIPNNRHSLCHVNPGPPTFGETSQDTKNLIPNSRSSWCHWTQDLLIVS